MYLTQDAQVALLEAEALLGSPDSPTGVIANPASSWLTLNIQVNLRHVADLTDPASQLLLETNAQELTGNWRGYKQRGPHTTIAYPVGSAPTQELGKALFDVAGLEGFRTYSARLAYKQILVIFPTKLQSGSYVRWRNPLTNTLEAIP